MPGKSRHGKGRRSQYKKRTMQRQSVTQPAQTAAVTTGASYPVAAKTAPPSKTQVTSTAATRVQYPFFTSELKRIGIISGIIIIILIVLTVILT